MSLHQDVKKSQRAAFAVGTRNNLKTQWKSFLLFTTFFNLVALPATLQTICLYAQFLSRSFKSVASIRNYLNGVKLLHFFLGFECVSFKSLSLSLLLKGVSRINPHVPRRVLPITPAILLQFHSSLQLCFPFDATIWCAFLLSFFLMARKSNMVPKSIFSFDSHKHLTRGKIFSSSKGLIVLLTWSKTIQTGGRVLKIPLMAIPNHPLCPVAAFRNMVSLVPASSSSPAFVVPTKIGLRSLTFNSYVSALRKLLSQAGFEPSLYSGHSFRRGGASWAFHSGVPGELIQLHGDWQSDAYLLYLSHSLQSKCSVSCAMAQALPNL